MPAKTSTTLFNSRLLIMLFLGFSSGLPLALTSSTLQAWFTEAQINLVTIGALSLLGIPYLLKPLWAPLMDYYSLAWLGRRRGWILLAQIGLVITLFILAQMDPGSQLSLMLFVALLIAFFAASQDIAVDAYRTDVLPPTELGLGAAYFVFAFRVATLVAGGLALICADYIGWQATYEIMAILILLSMLPTWFAPKIAEVPMPSGHLMKTMLDALLDLLTREKIILLLLVVIFYKFGAALTLSLMTTFLLKGLGFTLLEVGSAYKIVSFVATILGTFIGGIILMRCSLYNGLLWFGLMQACSSLMFALLALIGKHFTLMTLAVFIEYFCSGLSTAAFLAFLMSLCNHQFTATQYALLSALDSMGRVLLGPVAGVMVASLGWAQFFIWAFVLCFPGIIFLMLFKQRVFAYATTN
ncbi:MAG TPA: MFS transporter [Gammaproteobacteria bacterium]|jgi:PAT family beta-lactamase induction signal transducer AmpG|nr:MFS transporter [Gammaproteobacteria bacterium]